MEPLFLWEKAKGPIQGGRLIKFTQTSSDSASPGWETRLFPQLLIPPLSLPMASMATVETLAPTKGRGLRVLVTYQRCHTRGQKEKRDKEHFTPFTSHKENVDI